MTNRNFSYDRRTPTNVLTIEAGFNLVEAGGKRLDTLREDFYDNAVNIMNRFGQFAPIVTPYDIALSGGEPFAVWK
jgi:hypothetical protein